MVNNSGPLSQVTQPRVSTYQKVGGAVKSIIIYSALTALTALSFQFAMINGNIWLKTVGSLCILNANYLPKILHSNNEKMIRIGLIVNSIVFGVLPMGGAAAFSVQSFQLLLTALKGGQISLALFQGALATGIVGFIVPGHIESCRMSKDLLHYPKVWQEKIADIIKQFQHLPHLFPGAILQLALLKPDSSPFALSSHHYFFAIRSALLPEISLNRWNESLRKIEDEIDNFEPKNILSLSQYYKAHLEVLLKRLKKEDFDQALPSFLAFGSKLVPNVLSKEAFLELFKGEVLNKTDELIKKFLDESAGLKEYEAKYQKLTKWVTLLEQNLGQNNLSVQEKKDLTDAYESINKEFIDLKQNIKDLSLLADHCKKLTVFCSDPTKLPFKQKDQLALILQDSSLFNKINQLHFLITESNDRYEQMFGKLNQLINQLPSLRNSFESINDDILPLCKKYFYAKTQLKGSKLLTLTNTFSALNIKWRDCVQDYAAFFTLINAIPAFKQQILNFHDLTLEERRALFDTSHALKQAYEDLQKTTSKIAIEINSIKNTLRNMQESQDKGFMLTELNNTRQYYQTLQNQFDTFIPTLLNTQGTNLQPNLFDRIQLIRNKIATLANSQNDDDTQPNYMIFANQYHFVLNDFEKLRQTLGVDSSTDPHVDVIEDGMKAIGLNTQKDIKESGILDNLPQGQLLLGKMLKEKEEAPKKQIFYNLETYIKNYKKPSSTPRINSPQIQPLQPSQPSDGLKAKVAYAVYRMINSGLLMVPVLVYPYPAAAGFVIGTWYYSLKCFGFPGMQQLEARSNEFFKIYSKTAAVLYWLKPPIIKFPQSSRDYANKFFNVGVFERIQSFAGKLFYTYITNMAPTSSLRGFTLAQEIFT